MCCIFPLIHQFIANCNLSIKTKIDFKTKIIHSIRKIIA